jgi:dTMP kinase
VVIADRFFLSTYAYQCGGRELPERTVREANALATGGLVPDLTLLLRMPADTGLARAAGRGAADRMERAGKAFHQRVADAFRIAESESWQHAHPECGPVVALDATGSEEDVAGRVRGAVSTAFPGVSIAAEAGAS